MRSWGVRLVAAVALVAALVVGDGTRPAAAFVSTGTVTVNGSYSYSYSSELRTTRPYSCCPQYDYDWYSTSTSIYVSSWACADTWTGTTAATSSAGASCTLSLGGSHWSGDMTSSGSTLRFNGTYVQSSGTWGYYLDLTGGIPGGTFSEAPGVLTGNLTSGDGHAGPVTIEYALVPTYTYSCSPWCYPGSYYEYASGVVTLTIDYVVH